jgi:L-2-amino-thiazoline-4-carboxylic acid hydrolase
MGTADGRRGMPLIDRVKIQAELLVPLVKALEAELGAARAHELVRRALGDYYRNLAAQWSAQTGSMGAMETFLEVSGAGEAIDVTMHESSSSRMAFDVTGCRYADFFHAIGEPELGFLLVCSGDFALAEGIPGVVLERTTTIMQGAEVCDFRYRFQPEQLHVADHHTDGST